MGWFRSATAPLVTIVLLLSSTFSGGTLGVSAGQSDDATVRAFHIPGGICAPIQGVNPAPGPAGCASAGAENAGSQPQTFYVAQRNDATYDRSDCPATNEATGVPSPQGGIFASNVGLARYVVSVVSDVNANGRPDSSDPPITSASVYLLGIGTHNLNQVVPLSGAGDRESSAFDGIDQGLTAPPGPYFFNGSCNDASDVSPATPDGHANDYESEFIKSHSGTLAGTSPEQHLWRLLVTAGGHQSVTVDLTNVTDDLGDQSTGAQSIRGMPGPPLTNPDPQCGIDSYGCNIGLGSISLPLVGTDVGSGTVTGTVFSSSGPPLSGVTVLLTDAQGSIYTTVTTAGGFYAFQSVYPGPATLLFADNQNDYAGCGPGAGCGNLPGTVTVNVVTNSTANQNFTMTSKFAPSAAELALPAGTSGVFGYVDNHLGQGIGNFTITAQLCTGAGAPSGCTTASPVAGATPGPALSEFGTGRWRMGGLAPGARYVISASGPGLNAQTCASANPPAPNQAAGNLCQDEIVAGPAGTWTDPVFVVGIPANVGATPTVTATVVLTATPSATPVLNSLQGHVADQRVAAPPNIHQLSLWVGFYQTVAAPNPATTLVGTPVTVTTDQNGNFTVLGVPGGTYDVRVKHAQAISVEKKALVFGGGNVVVQDFGLLLAGDIDQNDQISASDFTVLKQTFGQPTICATQNPIPNPCADLDANGNVGPNDFSLLKQNFGLTGPMIIP
jgi:hypothetical protein